MLGLVLLVTVVNLAIEDGKTRVMGTPLSNVRLSPIQRVLRLLVLIAKVQVQEGLIGGFFLAIYWRRFHGRR